MHAQAAGPDGSGPEPEPRLWTRDFSLITFASALGAAGGIAGGFALSFFVFDETGSTLASALILAIQLIPHVLIPLSISPIMDRLPRKTFLVAGDIVCGIAYALLGLWLLRFSFSYIGYLAASLVIACLEAVDQLAWTSIYPEVIPEGAEQKGYAVSAMLYTTLAVIMSPFAAILLDVIGVPMLLIIEGGLAVCAAAIESFVHVTPHERDTSEPYSFGRWTADLKEALAYLKKEKGLRNLFSYMAISNGVATGYPPIEIAFFRTAPGLSAAMYALYSAAEFVGRTIASGLQYRLHVPKEKRFPFTFLVYQVYSAMDAILLWLPYPLMLANRGICGFLGGNSVIIREAATQRYIPEYMRSRINAFSGALMTAAGSAFSLVMGGLGELFDYRVCMSLGGLACLFAGWMIVWRQRAHVRHVLEAYE